MPDKTGPLSEAEIRAHTVGELKPLAAKIEIADYDAAWPGLYQREAARIHQLLGERVLQLEHTGSTSVPGLAAKPLIDMLLVVADSGDEAAYAPALERGGYVLRIREPEWFEHRVFKGPDTDINLHVLSRGCPEVARILLFRDWLRTHPDDRELYARTKRALAQQDWKYVQNYADAKSRVVGEILDRAESNCAPHSEK